MATTTKTTKKPKRNDPKPKPAATETKPADPARSARLRSPEMDKHIMRIIEDVENDSELLSSQTESANFTLNGHPAAFAHGQHGDALVLSYRHEKALLNRYINEGHADSVIEKQRKLVERLQKQIASLNALILDRGTVRQRNDEVLTAIRQGIYRFGEHKFLNAPPKEIAFDEPTYRTKLKTRRRVAAAYDELRHGDLPNATVKERIRTALNTRGKKGRTRISSERAYQPDASAASAVSILGGDDKPADILLEVLCVIPHFREPLEKYLIEDAERHADVNGDMTPDERQQKLFALQDELDELDREIEAQVLAAKASGRLIARAEGQSPWSVLQIRPVGRLREFKEYSRFDDL